MAEAIPIMLILTKMHVKRLQEPHKNTLALFFKRVHYLFGLFPVLLPLAAISSCCGLTQQAVKHHAQVRLLPLSSGMGKRIGAAGWGREVNLMH